MSDDALTFRDAVAARTLRHFRRTAAKGRRFTDWTVNVEPLRAGEVMEDA